jgi:RNA polymerase sigma factor (sigma-70 family)
MATAQLGTLLHHLRKLGAGPPAPDRKLLEDFAERGDEAAFAALVACHGPMVLRVCRRVLGHEQDAEDAFQATFLVLARNTRSIHKREALAGWLHGVAYRTAMKAKRSAARRHNHEARLRAQSPRTAPAPTWDEVQTVLDEEIQRLPEVFRTAFVLCVLEGKTRAEAAGELNCKEGTVSSRLMRARKLLQQRLGRRGIELSALLAALSLAETGSQAAVPAVLARSAVQAGLLVAAGEPVAGVIPPHVAALATGVSRTYLASAVLLAMILGVAALACQAFAGKEGSSPPPDALEPTAAKPAQAVEIRGQVLDPDGKPFLGAQLYLLTSAVKKKEDLRAAATSDADGRFRLVVDARQLEQGAKVVATGKGLGPAWISLSKGDKSEERTLRLVRDDVPIQGRVIDLQGRPVAGVTVEVLWVDQGDLKRWLEEKKHNAYPQFNSIRPVAVDGPTTLSTDKDGRFRLSGFGRDRIVLFKLHGPGIEDSVFHVITRNEGVPEDPSAFDGTYRATFKHLAGPSKPIVGTVRDKVTGKPLAGITVASVKFIKQYTKTDEHGRYRIEGARKHKDYTIGAGGIPYFASTKDVADTPGFEPLTVDFELERGLAIRGRLLDKATGKPLKGHVVYTPLEGNPYLKDFTELGKSHFIVDERGDVAADGSYYEIAIPGPGLLCAYAWDADGYLPAKLEDWKTAPFSLVLECYHAILPIDPSEKDPKTLTVDIALQPGRRVKGEVLSPDGKPLAGTLTAGLHPISAFWYQSPEKLEGSSFTVGGMGPGPARPLVFVHPEKKLARVVQVPADEKGPLTIRLEPQGGVCGRVLDTVGKPWAGLKVTVSYRVQELREAPPLKRLLPWDLFLAYPAWSKVLNRAATTDAEGRFRLEGLVPGLEYDLRAAEGGNEEAARVFSRERLSVEAGKVHDLGDCKSKQARPEGGE